MIINRKNIACKSAFTLIEMLVVMALMALMIGIGAASFYGIGGSSALNGAVNEVQGALSLARQQTVMQNSSVNIYFYQDENSNDIVYEMWAMTNGVSILYRNDNDKYDTDTVEGENNVAIRDDRDNKYGYKLGSLFHFPKGLTVSVNGIDITDTHEEYISLRPTGSTAVASPFDIELTLKETDKGYKITVYPITGLTSVKDIL